MALKSIIDKATFDKLPEAIQAEYKTDGDNYVLDILGLEEHPQAGALKRAHDRVKDELKTAKDELKTAEDAKNTAVKGLEDKIKELEANGESGADVKKLRKEYETKITKLENDFKAKLDSANSDIKDILVDSMAETKAKEWSKVPSLMKGQIADRLTVERDDKGKPVTRVLDKDGNVSAMSIEDLKNEIYSNKEFEPILIGSRGDGGSAPNQPGGNNGGSAPNGGGDVDPETLSPKQLAERVAARHNDYQGV